LIFPLYHGYHAQWRRWQDGTTQIIRWSYTGNPGSTVNIELLKGGSVFASIASGVSIGSAGSGSYSWTILRTQTPGEDYRVRVTSVTIPSCTDDSDSNFKTSAPQITVTSPNGGELWPLGKTQTIQWTYTGNLVTYVKVDLL
jgi:hypothetical protein